MLRLLARAQRAPRFAVLAAAALSALTVGSAQADGPVDPIKQVAATSRAKKAGKDSEPASAPAPAPTGRFVVRTTAGLGDMPVYTWPAQAVDALNHSGIPSTATRAVIVVHGIRRNAAEELADVQRALGKDRDNVILVAPRFSEPADLSSGDANDRVLTWRKGNWSDGEPAAGPAAISSFDVLDEMLMALSDRAQFPALRQIVVAGFSAGGQLVQRYAAVGSVFAAVERTGVTLRWVVGDPGSLLYFDGTRPTARGGLASFRASACPGFNQWKYGFEQAPEYAANRNVQWLAADYAQRDVVYLLGGKDTNALHPALDKSCEGEAQGVHRYARLRNYIGYMKAREPQRLAHRWGVAPDAGHSAGLVYNSACGKAALFDAPGCTLNAASGALPPMIP
ncbi:hypothetical protein GCM10007242_23370 [Pigmentiphaga litoralis]|uniref:alpha/beta hydrolase n=1 Tax=Pigmentiphaga litoralis TaxID=516702 RepID=UPI001679DEA8|nr:alpha/beta hydrolase [Pigmentiphaga litoralis]GGX16130.1 hypothetical protein GCM10007242_23370 [Pigmentiphaga litoralis]